MSGRSPRATWLLVTLPLAAICTVLYFTSEWLFIVTKPSSLASLPFGVQLEVLGRAPVPLLLTQA